MTRIRFARPDARVFIFGVEVTEDVKSLGHVWTDKRAPSTVEFTLVNTNDKYIVTPLDLLTIYKSIDLEAVYRAPLEALAQASAESEDDGGSSSEERMAQADVENTQVVNQLLDVVTAQYERASSSVRSSVRGVKGSVIATKLKERTQVNEPPPADSYITTSKKKAYSNALEKLASLSGEAPRYPFQVGQFIFHTNDPVTVFERDPFDATKWYWTMSGYLTDWSEDVSAGGSRTIRVVAEGALRTLKHSLVSTNWALYDIAALNRSDKIALARTWFSEGFSGLSLPELVYLMIFGANAAGVETRLPSSQVSSVATDEDEAAAIRSSKFSGVQGFDGVRLGIHGRTEFKASTDGAGSFDFANSKVYLLSDTQVVTPPGAEEDSAQGYTFSIGVKKAEPPAANQLERWQNAIDTQVVIEDLLTKVVTDGQDVAESTYLEALSLKNSGTKLGLRLATEKVISFIGGHPEFYPVDHGRVFMLLPSTLGEERDLIVRDLVNDISQKSQFTNRLAILLNLVEKIEFSLYDTPKGDIVIEMPLYDYEPRNFGRFAQRYIISDEDTCHWSSSFSDEHIKTMVAATYNISPKFSIGKSVDVWAPPGIVSLDAMIAQFGVRLDYLDPHSAVTSARGAAYYAHMALNKNNADAWRASVRTVSRLGIGPNRPIQFSCRHFIATTRSVTHTLTAGSSGGLDQTLETNYRRGWSGMQTDDGYPVFEPLGGMASRPLNYRELLSRDSGVAPTTTMPAAEAELSAADDLGIIRVTSTPARTRTGAVILKPGQLAEVDDETDLATGTIYRGQ